MILFTLTATIALVIACLAFWTYEFVEYRAALRLEMGTIAHMLADNSSAALAFNDARAGSEAVSLLRTEPRVIAGCLRRANGGLLGVYGRDRTTPVCPAFSAREELHFTNSQLLVNCPVSLDGETVGAVWLAVDLTEMYVRLLRFGGIGLAVLLLASLAALALASRLQWLISAPILHLTSVATEVSERRSYEVRAEKLHDDELGTLVQRFNEMMTQIQQRDAALQAAQDELENRVVERTRELQNEIAERKAIEHDLLIAKAAAEESNRAKSDFLANMSHELRTPLNAIIGYSELLQEEAIDNGNVAIIQDLERINSAGKQLLILITDVLDLSKVEAGRMEVHMEEVPVSDLIDSVASTIEPLARKNGNRFEVAPETYAGAMVVDPVKFRQSLLNLLSNACKFTENGSITLGVDRREREGKEWIAWQVRDTGIGIAPQNIDKLFRSFSQVDSSATRKFGGTGLGLAISQRFCQMMGGHITVESEVGQGSTFTIYVPGNAAPPSEPV